MQVMVVLDWSRTTLQEIGSKFASGQDVDPEKGTILHRWHDPAGKKAWIIVEVPDGHALHDWLTAWSDYMDVETHVVVGDEEVGAILEKRLS